MSYFRLTQYYGVPVTGGGWTPSDHPTGWAWHDISDINTLFQDVAKTTPVTASGQGIGASADKFGTPARDLLGYSTPTTFPVYLTNQFNGLPAADADGDANARALNGVVPAGAKTIYLVAHGDVFGNNDVLWSVGNNAKIQMTNTPSQQWRWNTQQNLSSINLGGNVTGTLYLWVLKVVSASVLSIYRNGSLIQTFDPNDQIFSSTAMTLLADIGGGPRFINARFCEQLVATGADGDSLRGQAEAYFRAKWNIW